MTSRTQRRDPDENIANIRSFLLAAEALPSPKGAALRLIELANDPAAGVSEAVEVIRTDPALTGFVIRAANAARFGNVERTLDLGRAVTRVGMAMVREHALALSMLRDQPQLRCEPFDYTGFWTESLYTATLLDALARRFRVFRPGEAFVLGLLAGIGRLAFATAAPADYALVLQRAATGGAPLAALEQQVFGFNHHELSSVLLADWGIPTELADVIYWQCDPEGGGFAPDSRPYRLAGLLQLGAGMATVDLAADSADSGLVYLRAAVLELDEEAIVALRDEARAELREWLQTIGLPLPSILGA